MSGLGRTLSVARPAAGRLALATLLGAAAIGAAIGLLATSAWLISRASQRPSESALGVAIVGVQFFALSRGLLRYGERLVGHDAAFRVLADLRIRVYRRLETLAPTGLPAFRSGDLLARLVQDVDSLQDVVLRVIPPFAIAVVVGGGTVGLVWWLLPASGLILLASLLLAATIVPWLTGTLARRSESGQAAARGELAASVVDLIDGAPDLAVFGATGAQLGRVAAADAELSRAARASAGTAGIGLALTTLLAGLATWGSLLVGIPAVHSGRLDGTLLAVIVLVPLAAFELVVGLPVATQVLQRTRRSAERVFAVMDAPAPVAEPSVPAPISRSIDVVPRHVEGERGAGVAGRSFRQDVEPEQCAGTHELRAASVSARYPGQPARAVDSVDLALPPGRRVAVIGPSGAGKSALAAVLLRFLPYEDGSVALDGVELASLAGDDVRTVVGLVTQDAHIFETTLAQNLRVGRHDATDPQLRAALDRVGLGPWLAELPAGLSTEVGGRGARLSGGQRQRVAVARAVLAEFPVLVLDEPAEHLDRPAADAMTADLLALTSGRSTVLITHRLAGLEAVDEVLVLDAGRVVERGTHDELLGAGGSYCDLWWREMAAAGGGAGEADDAEERSSMR
ncbi:MAG TPA: thiol reductant ABC exporter subunit CydC [Acidimicrobiales bacterium]